MAAHFFRKILTVLSYMHSELIVHRDLKNENFMLLDKSYDSDIKIIDFGLSRKLKDKNQTMQAGAGSPYFMSPEVLAKNYTIACDMWSAGVMLYAFIAGYPPFYGEEEEDIYVMTRKGKFDYDPKEWDHIAPEAKDLVNSLLTKEEKRLTAAQALQHPWLLAHDERVKNL
jgi:calcium-dependent protein kinase